jgi:hypothetical protein
MAADLPTSGPGAHTREKLIIGACACLMFAGSHALLEATSRFAERHLGVYLWKHQDYLRLLSPANHVGRGRGRLLMYGPSEAREGFLGEEIKRVTTGLEPYQNSQSLGTLEDGLLVLQYIEAVHGPSAIPSAILLGVTPRFLANIRRTGVSSPLQDGINRYSPHLRVVEGSHPPALARRTPFEAIVPTFDLLRLQPDRYRRGLYAIAVRSATRIVPSLAAWRRGWEPTSASKYLEGRLAPEATIKSWLVSPTNAWAKVHVWDARRDRERVIADVGAYRAFAAKHAIELYVVNLPEISWSRELYEPGRYEAYLEVLTEALGPTPFLDLRTLLPDSQFFDDAHPTWEGGIRVSKEVGLFIERHRRASGP